VLQILKFSKDSTYVCKICSVYIISILHCVMFQGLQIHRHVTHNDVSVNDGPHIRRW